MESNSDKILRDKLKGLEAGYNPQAWEQMEELLEEKKKRRGFFWWWTGAGMAAAFLLGAGVLFLYLQNGHTKVLTQLNNGSKPIINKTEHKEEVPNIEVPLANKGLENKTRVKPSVNLTGALTVKNNDVTYKPASNKKITSGNLNSTGIKEKRKQQQIISNLTANEENGLTQKKMATEKEKQETEVLQQTAEQKVQAAVDSPAVIVNDESNTVAVAKTDTTTQTGQEIKKEEKKKKKIFQYSIGAVGHISAATLGRRVFTDDTLSRKRPFDKSPSFMLGFTQELMLLNRIALTNSFVYSQTSFTVYKTIIRDPQTGVADGVDGLQYTSKIKELAIPIGIKLYPLVKPKIRVYAHFAIINHIKLKETFVFNSPPTAQPLAPSALSDNSFPFQTNFNQHEADAVIQSGYIQYNSTNDFSIKRAKRYYASFYAAIGVEGIIKQHWVIFAEPAFFMNIPMVGIQERSKTNLGLTAGFRYQFK